MTDFRIIMSVTTSGGDVTVERMEVELEDAEDKQIALDAMETLNIGQLLHQEHDTEVDMGIDSNTAMALAMGHLGVGQ